jgi:hypothetical protein
MGVAKYGYLDVRFIAPDEVLAGEPGGGTSLLRELGYLPAGDAETPAGVCDDPICLEMLRENLDEGRTWVRLLLEGGRPGPESRFAGPDGHVSYRVPKGYLPRPFRIADACVTNAAGVWLWKHFYL